VITTIHGFSSERILPVYRKYDGRSHYVAISDSDRHPSLQYAATIHHGIDMSAFAIGTGPRDYLLFFGRIHPDKGAEEAILVASSAQSSRTSTATGCGLSARSDPNRRATYSAARVPCSIS